MVVLVRDRYVVFQVLCSGAIPDLSTLKRKIWSTYQTLFGLSGTSEAGLFFDTYDLETGKGIIRCTSKSFSPLMTTLSLIQKISDDLVIIVPLLVSGTIKKAKECIESNRFN
ncbi:MAG: Rpp14/Pop5 family protein [Candidatus Heimdallarchaeaceae archaeon]